MKEKVITKINKFKSKVKIYFDDETMLEIHPNTFIEFRLYENKHIFNKDIKEIKEFDKNEKLYEFILKKFALKNYTSGKVKELLKKKNAKDDQIEKIINRLMKNKILDESNFVKEVIDYADYKHYGYNKIISKLWDLKVSPVLINLVKYDENKERKNAQEFIKKNERKYDSKNDAQKKKCLYSSLLRAGFKSDISLELVNKIANSNNNHEINVLKLDYVKVYSKYSKKYIGLELKQRIENNLVSKGYKISDIKNVEENKI